MLNILRIKKNNVNPSDNNYINKKQNTIQNKLDRNEYNNIIYYPASSKEWYSSIYSYNKSYVKALVSLNSLANNLLWNYFNMLAYKIRFSFKRRRPNKIRYSSNKIFISNAEFKHTNSKLTIFIYAYNKKKLSIENFLSELATVSIINNNNNILSTEKIEEKREEETIKDKNNRLALLLKQNLLYFKKWSNNYLTIDDNLLKHKKLNFKRKYLLLHNIPYNIKILWKKSYKLQQIILNATKAINFNKLKFTNLFAYFGELGLNSILQKIYGKKIEIKLIELKSIHLNSDLFASAVALKLRDRQNKAINVLKKAIICMVKVPDLHTLITFDDNKEKINKKNILKVISQQVVSGVRFEAAGRLTRRLTAMRAVFKVRYTGSLKNIRSSLNSKSSTMLRGYVKSNLQYTIINSKTRNGTFGLKCWVSSHFILDIFYVFSMYFL